MGSKTDERRKRALELELPETATWADIEKRVADNFLQETAESLGLPETASWGDVYLKQASFARSGSERRHGGLPESAT